MEHSVKPPAKLALQQIERRLRNLRLVAKDAQVHPGWISYMREAMCMTQSILARAAGLNQTTVYQIEKRESAGKVTIQTMRKIAAAMDCEFVYAIIPKEDLDEFLKKKARAKAARLVREADVHMALEDQRVTEDIEERIERVAEDLLVKGDIW
jgi:predicted DNA-binding mobile mystery protein A